jgi:hypothetical protein
VKGSGSVVVDKRPWPACLFGILGNAICTDPWPTFIAFEKICTLYRSPNIRIKMKSNAATR